MNVNVNTTTNFTVYGKTRAGARVPVPAGIVPTVTLPHAASVAFDPVASKGSFVAPATAGSETITVSNGALLPYAAPISYVLDPNEVIALDVSFP